MRTDRAVLVPLIIGTSVVLFGLAVYSPLMMAWSNRHERMSGSYVEVEFSWFMQRASFLYVPLTKFHASWCGYDYFTTRERDGEFSALEFVKPGTLGIE